MELPLAADREACCAVDELQSLPAQGVRLRTRELTTTMLAADICSATSSFTGSEARSTTSLATRSRPASSESPRQTT